MRQKFSTGGKLGTKKIHEYVVDVFGGSRGRDRYNAESQCGVSRLAKGNPPSLYTA